MIIARQPGRGVIATVSFTPAAAAYSAADIVEGAKEIAFTMADSGAAVAPGSIIRVKTTLLKIDATAVISGETSYSLALYTVTPPSALADNAAYTLSSADLPSYSGVLALGTPADLGAALFIQTQYTDKQDYRLVSSSLYGYLIAAGAATYAAVARQVTIYGEVV